MPNRLGHPAGVTRNACSCRSRPARGPFVIGAETIALVGGDMRRGSASMSPPPTGCLGASGISWTWGFDYGATGLVGSNLTGLISKGVKMRKRTTLAAIAGVVCGVLVIAGVAFAAGARTRQVTLGSTTGTPSENICVAGIRCTYLPISQPKLRVPFGGRSPDSASSREALAEPYGCGCCARPVAASSQALVPAGLRHSTSE